jgi:hypothetical protein
MTHGDGLTPEIRPDPTFAAPLPIEPAPMSPPAGVEWARADPTAPAPLIPPPPPAPVAAPAVPMPVPATPTPRPRRTRRGSPGALNVLLAVLVIVGTVCTVAAHISTRRSDTGGPQPPGTVIDSSAQLPAGDLRTLLEPPPATSRPFSKPMSADGTLTKQQVAGAFDDPAGVLAVLDQYHWTAGAVAQWHNSDDSQVTIKLYRFDTPEDAQAWFDYVRPGYTSDVSRIDQSPITGIAGSGMYRTKSADSKGYILTNGVAVHGSIYMIVFVWQLDRQNRSDAINIMRQQFYRLP